MENNAGQRWLIVTSDEDKAFKIMKAIITDERENGNYDTIIERNIYKYEIHFENNLRLLWLRNCENFYFIDCLWCEKENVSHLLNHNVIFNPKYLDYYKYITLI